MLVSSTNDKETIDWRRRWLFFLLFFWPRPTSEWTNMRQPDFSACTKVLPRYFLPQVFREIRDLLIRSIHISSVQIVLSIYGGQRVVPETTRSESSQGRSEVGLTYSTACSWNDRLHQHRRDTLDGSEPTEIKISNLLCRTGDPRFNSIQRIRPLDLFVVFFKCSIYNLQYSSYFLIHKISV